MSDLAAGLARDDGPRDDGLIQESPGAPSIGSTLLDRLRPGSAPVRHERGATLCHERRRNEQVAVLESGLCVALKRTRDGQQQTIAIYVPGDLLDHETVTLGAATSSIVAMTPVVCHRLATARLRDTLERDRDLAALFWRYVAFQGSLAQEWMLGLGRRPALERTAHLLCEIVYRMRASGQGSEFACGFPLTQNDLSDILGLSVVHVNRTLQRLRQTGYVALQRGRLEIADWPRLTAMAGFETAYLDDVPGA